MNFSTKKPPLTLVLFLSILLSCGGQEDQPTPITPSVQERNPYSLGRVGNAEDIQTTTEAAVVLMGGSTDVDAAMRWMIEKAGKGDIVVIRVTGAAAYNEYIYGLSNTNSVETLRINSSVAANDDRVIATLRNAEAVFIAGGDQSNYLRHWEGTKVEETLQYLIHEKKVPIGGTSAGCAIMGEFVYTGENGSIVSSEALSNPFDDRLTVRRSSLINHPLLKNTVTDQHFAQRNREGRLLSFLANIFDRYEIRPTAIGVDERTAVLIDKSGKWQIVGEHDAYFLKSSENGPELITPNTPLTWNRDNSAVSVFRSAKTSEFSSTSIKDWELPWTHYWYADNGSFGSRAL
ncbi:cyanophycinase [Belliella kenyensis]|uniref:Cyanophycinase n=1 Tax=Belliella kenyensis TaxID=1472724 RepID=A0ABV8EP55_9BACT|nr:cyanophycinase [Belliella kenyensis]MCH7402920.1 cyanophycinase [Belliella kenyensis]MDN3602626.1 cyanophycinase [Belliella kenyensis]